MRSILTTVLWVGLIIVLAIAVDQITPLNQHTSYLDQHPEPYRSITIILSVAGWGLLLGVLVVMLWRRGRTMSEGEAKRFMQESPVQTRVSARFSGIAAGREYRAEASFREIKAAVRSGEWRRDPGWWPLLAGLAAIILIVYGMFGYFIVTGPALVKVLCGGALLYATARSAWGFIIA